MSRELDSRLRQEEQDGASKGVRTVGVYQSIGHETDSGDCEESVDNLGGDFNLFKS
jgi:hypothetical protein